MDLTIGQEMDLIIRGEASGCFPRGGYTGDHSGLVMSGDVFGLSGDDGGV